MKKFESVFAISALVLMTVNWGLSACATKFLLDEVLPMHQLAAQTSTAALCLFAFGALRRGKSFFALPSRGALAVLHVRAVLSGVIGVGMVISAYRFAPIATVVWLQMLPMGVLWSLILFGERLSTACAAFLLLGVGGVGCMQSSSLDGLGSFSGFGIGEILALAGSTLFALSYVIGGSVVKEIGVLRAAFWNLLLMALFSSLGAMLIEGVPSIPSLLSLAVLIGTGATIAMNSAILFYGPARLPTSVVCAVLSLEAVWGPLFAFFFYKQVPTVAGLVGGSIVVVSAIGVTLCAKPRT